MRRRLPLALAAPLVVLLLAACDGTGDGGGGDGRTPPGPPPTPRVHPATTAHQAGVRLSDDLVTASIGDACVECHEDVATAFASSGMHESLTLPTGAGSIEARMVGREVVDGETGITGRMELGDGHYVQRLVYRDPDGMERASHAMRIDLVVGSGHATRSYFQVEGPLLFQLPLTWYAQLDDVRLSPGPGFRSLAMRHAIHLCVSCHTGWVEPADPRSDVGFRGTVSTGIGCVRCHGAADEHCATGDPKDVANPSRMSAERQADVCEQCHRAGSLNLVKRGVAFAAYTPGERLGKVYGIFEPVTGRDDMGTSIAGHGARMRLSRCFTESEGMTCTTCHNPHRGHKEAQTAKDTGSGCYVCHQADACHEDEAARQGRTCAGCHMVPVPSNDIVHTRTTDHFVRRRPPSDPPRGDAPESHGLDAFAVDDVDIVNVLDPDDELPGSRLLKVRAYLQGASMAAMFRGRPAAGYLERASVLLDELRAAAPDDDEVLFERARLLVLQRHDDAAIVQLDALLARSPDWAEAVKMRALLTLSSGDAAAAETELRRAHELAAHDEETTLRLAFLLADNGRAAEGLDLVDGLRRLSGPSVRSAEAAATLASAAGLPARGVRHAYDVLLFRPRDPRALAAAGDVCRDAGLPDRQCRVLFEQALRIDPGAVPALVGLARLELREGDVDAARRRLHAAAAAAPDDPAVRRLAEELRGR